MKLPLTYYGNPILRKKTTRVDAITDELRQLVNDMVETMHESNGIGLAAPQINQSISLFITDVPIKAPGNPDNPEDPNGFHWEPGTLRVFINPKIIFYSEEQWHYSEGCLSIPGLSGDVTRPVTIKVQATDIDGNAFEGEFSWLEARCIMHENDHINGVLFIDRIHGKERKDLDPKLNEIKRKFR